MIHTLDCPHGNFWFFIWHRAYIGWFEQIVRHLTGDDEFALSFWDWTAYPYIHRDFFEGVLDIQNYKGYIPTFAEFKEKFEPTVEQYWSQLSATQLALLTVRGYPNVASFWARAVNMFPTPTMADARGSTEGGVVYCVKSNPQLLPVATAAVSLEHLNAALAQESFVGPFGSGDPGTSGTEGGHGKSSVVCFGIFENYPHNQVHNSCGQQMSGFMSPIDPLFWLHHGNVDRVWNIWNQKQQRLGYNQLPQDPTVLHRWVIEPFDFFVNAYGERVSGSFAGRSLRTAGAYVTNGQFGEVRYGHGMGDVWRWSSPIGNNVGPNPVSQVTLTSTSGYPGGTAASAEFPVSSVDIFNSAAGVIAVTVEMAPVMVGTNPVSILVELVGITDSGETYPANIGTFEFFGTPHYTHVGASSGGSGGICGEPETGNFTFTLPLYPSLQVIKQTSPPGVTWFRMYLGILSSNGIFTVNDVRVFL